MIDDEQAIALLKSGDMGALESLVNRHQVRAVQTAYLIVRDRNAAEEIAQDCFLKAAKRIHQFKDGRPFRPWFLRMVTNDALKTAARLKRSVPLEDFHGSGADDAWWRDPHPEPQEMIDTAENRVKVWRALGQLTTKQRTAIVLRYFLDMPNKEIARELDRPLSSVKWSLHAARARLKTLLGGEGRRRGPRSSAVDPEEGPGEGGP